MNFTLLKLFFIFTLLTNFVPATPPPTWPTCFHKTQENHHQDNNHSVDQQQAVVWSDGICLRPHSDSHDCSVHHLYPLVDEEGDPDDFLVSHRSYPLVDEERDPDDFLVSHRSYPLVEEGDPDDFLVSHRSNPAHADETTDLDVVYGDPDDSINQHRHSNSPDGPHGDAPQLDSTDRSSREILELCNDLQIDLELEIKELTKLCNDLRIKLKMELNKELEKLCNDLRIYVNMALKELMTIDELKVLKQSGNKHIKCDRLKIKLYKKLRNRIIESNAPQSSQHIKGNLMNIMLHRNSMKLPKPWVKVSDTPPKPQDIVHELRIAVLEGGSLSIHGLWPGIRNGIYIQHLRNEHKGSKNRRYQVTKQEIAGLDPERKKKLQAIWYRDGKKQENKYDNWYHEAITHDAYSKTSHMHNYIQTTERLGLPYLNGDANDLRSLLDNIGCIVGNYYDASKLRQALATKYGVDVLVLFKDQDGIPCLFEFGFLYDNHFQLIDHPTAAHIPEGIFLRSRNRF